MLQHEQSIKDLLIISRMWTHWAMTIVSPWISTFVVFVENMEEPEQTFLRFENIKQILVSSRFSFPMDAFLCWYSNKLFKHSSQHGPASRQQKQKSVCRVQMKGDNFHNMREKRAKCDEGWVLEREEGGRGGGRKLRSRKKASVCTLLVSVLSWASVWKEEELLLLLDNFCCCCRVEPTPDFPHIAVVVVVVVDVYQTDPKILAAKIGAVGVRCFADSACSCRCRPRCRSPSRVRVRKTWRSTTEAASKRPIFSDTCSELWVRCWTSHPSIARQNPDRSQTPKPKPPVLPRTRTKMKKLPQVVRWKRPKLEEGDV